MLQALYCHCTVRRTVYGTSKFENKTLSQSSLGVLTETADSHILYSTVPTHGALDW